MKLHFFISVLIISASIFSGCHKNKTEEAEPDPIEEAALSSQTEQNNKSIRSVRVKNLGSLSKVFNDSNYQQLEAARQLGIEPITDLYSSYFMKRPLVKIQDNEFYHLDTLRHSIPYLVPEAANLLHDIGANFIDSLHRRGGDGYTIKVTSLLRTPESVGRLRRVNINATDSSTHQFATTFDLSYINFYCLDNSRQINQGDLKNILAEVLYDLRQQGRCLVKYEYKTGCFHVTATR